MAKNKYENKLDGDELDLSMMNLTDNDISVKDIVSLTKVRKIDLSSNQLVALPSTFAPSLPQITRLELGSNKLIELPANIGCLKNLKHLDLYNNKLTDLPVSLHQLKSLKWLDLKGNPLNPELRYVAGDCLNQKECEAAAKNVANFMRQAQGNMERQKQKKLKEEREREAAQKKIEEDEKAKKRAEKKAAKERRKAEQDELNRKTANGGPSVNHQEPSNEAYKRLSSQTNKNQNKSSSQGGWSCVGVMNVLMLIVLFTSACVCAVVYTNGDLSMKGLKEAFPRLTDNIKVLYNLTAEALEPDNLKHSAITVRDSVMQISLTSWTALQEYTTDLTPYTKPIAEGAADLWHWTSGHTTNLYRWIVNNIDWDSIFATVKSAALTIHEKWLFACEEIGKNEAFISASSVIQVYSANAWVGVQQAMNVTGDHLQSLSVYVQNEGPVLLESVQQQFYTIYDTARESIEGYIN